MKNIPILTTLEMLYSRGNVMWEEIVGISRIKCGKSTHRRSRIVYAEKMSEAVTDFITWAQARGYVTIRSATSVQALLNKPDEENISTFISVETMSVAEHTIAFKVIGDTQECDDLIAWIDEAMPMKGSIIRTATGFNSSGRLEFDRKFIPNGKSNCALQSFYPWLNISIEEYFKAYMESSESVLVMFGPPGTGKSTFLRTLIASKNYDAIVAYNKQVVESPAVLNAFYRGSAKILAYEDIDKHLGKRENDNTLMSSILNAADGVVQYPDKKIVFVTNLPSIDRIDPALLRTGRCFDVLQFRNLTIEESMKVRQDLGMPEADWKDKQTRPLSEVIRQESKAQQTINRFANKIGFQ